jgi:hypothetical protein
VLELLARATEAWVVAAGNEHLVNRSSRIVDGVSRRCTAGNRKTATTFAQDLRPPLPDIDNMGGRAGLAKFTLERYNDKILIRY